MGYESNLLARYDKNKGENVELFSRVLKREAPLARGGALSSSALSFSASERNPRGNCIYLATNRRCYDFLSTFSPHPHTYI